MGCATSQPQETEGAAAPGAANGGEQAAPDQPQQPPQQPCCGLLTRLGPASTRGPQRSNVVPVPEGLYRGGGGPQRREDGGPRPQHVIPAAAPKMQNTQTVRSQVNVKKHSLKVVPEEGNPGQLQLYFTADTSVPSVASVYIMAYEKDGKADTPPRLKSKHSKREPSFSVAVNGLDQHCCTPLGQGIPLGSFEDEQLKVDTCSEKGIYPIVVRLQTEGEKVDKGGEEEAGAGVQAQTTMGTLIKQADGTYEVAVLKQVLWVSGTSYTLYEIFGIDRTPEEAGTADNEGSKECVICLAETRDTLALPCRHLCLCVGCAKALRYQSNKCPICRSVVDSLLQIRLAPGNLPEAGEALQGPIPDGQAQLIKVGDPEVPGRPGPPAEGASAEAVHSHNPNFPSDLPNGQQNEEQTGVAGEKAQGESLQPGRGLQPTEHSVQS